MSTRLDDKATLWLLQHGYDKNGKKIKRKKSNRKNKKNPNIPKYSNADKVIRNNRDLIHERKISELSDREMQIALFLAANQVQFHREWYMKGLYNYKTKKPLFFDFYLPKYNLVIEYDGKQHFEDADKYRLEQQKFKDNLKLQFCKKKNIYILRIPYWKQGRIEHLICERIDEIEKG